jgi:prepilin-type N-terminal cleavage/methylation domain-containing protein
MRAPEQAGVTLLEMMVVLAVVSLIIGLAFPSVTSGVETLRMRSAADEVSGLLAQAVIRVERAEQPFELLVSRAGGRLELRSVDGTFSREVKIGDGISISRVYPEVNSDPEAVRAVVFEPGAMTPRLGIELLNQRGLRRLVRLDPLTGIPVVETPSGDVQAGER